MAIPLLHQGMLLVGLPFTESAISQTRTGGTPYGATHVSGLASQPAVLSDHEIALAQALGKRVAEVAATLSAGRVAKRAGA
jgi:NAD(P)H dehydrogenase (quinone)